MRKMTPIWNKKYKHRFMNNCDLKLRKKCDFFRIFDEIAKKVVILDILMELRQKS